jgi:hypothetical protein
MFASPFSAEAEDAPSNMQMELTETQRVVEFY